MAANGTTHNGGTTELDVLVIGGGFGGCYLLKLMRDNGFKTRLVEAAARLGGVWAHNRWISCYHYVMRFVADRPW